jgi:hypothetical protein
MLKIPEHRKEYIDNRKIIQRKRYTSLISTLFKSSSLPFS